MKRGKRTEQICAGRLRRRGLAACTAWVMGLAVLAGGLSACSSAGAGADVVVREESSSDSHDKTGEDNAETGQEVQREEGGSMGRGKELPVIENGRITIEDTEIALEPEDEYSSWDDSSAVKISLNDSEIIIEGQGAAVQGSTVTIDQAGTYILKGKLSDGTILVDAGDEDRVRLVLDGVDIHSETSAAIDIKKAGKAVISLEEGTVNSLSDSPGLSYRDEEKEEPNGALFSKGDLTINGKGTLQVNAAFNNGICSKDVLKIAGGTMEVAAKNHGIKGNDALIIYDGSLDISAEGNGVKSDTLAAVLGGDILIRDCEEGIEAKSVVLYGGTIDLASRDDGINASTDEDGIPWIYLMGGTVTVRAEGDGMDSNGSIHMSGGQVTVYGPSGRDNGALDYDGEFWLTGGVLAAFGPGGMEQNVSSADSQVSVLVDFQEVQKAGTEVVLRNKEGEELYRGAGEKDFRTVVISVPAMEAGGEYEIEAGETLISFVPEETIVYVNREGVQEAAAMGPGGGGPGGRGGRMDGRKEGEPGQRPEPPKDREGQRRSEPPKGGEDQRRQERPDKPENEKEAETKE